MILNNLKKAINKKWNDACFKDYKSDVERVIEWMNILVAIENCITQHIYCQELKDGIFQYNYDEKTKLYYVEDSTMTESIPWGLGTRHVVEIALRYGLLEKDPNYSERGGAKYRVTELSRNNPTLVRQVLMGVGRDEIYKD